MTSAVFKASGVPLFLLGPLPSSLTDSDLQQIHNRVKELADELGAVVYVESLSQLSSKVNFSRNRIFSSRHLRKAHEFSGVVRVGGVPTHRIWRDLAKKDSEAFGVPVLSFDFKEFSGLPSDRPMLHHYQATDPSELLSLMSNLLRQVIPYRPKEKNLPNKNQLLEKDQIEKQIFAELCQEFPRSEVAWIQNIQSGVKAEDKVFLGNSLTVREWDLALIGNPPAPHRFEANRGANGIDGELSTFLGWVSAQRDCRGKNWCVLGDLTTIYDLSGPWVLPQLMNDQFRHSQNYLCVINNSGGKIFRQLPFLKFAPDDLRKKFFDIDFGFSFEKWAALWDLPYLRPKSKQELEDWVNSDRPSLGLSVIEIVPDPLESEKFWEKWNTK